MQKFYSDIYINYFHRFQAMKIHVSENTKALLDQVGGFILEKRGNIDIKVNFASPIFRVASRSHLSIPGKRRHGDILVAGT